MSKEAKKLKSRRDYSREYMREYRARKKAKQGLGDISSGVDLLLAASNDSKRQGSPLAVTVVADNGDPAASGGGGAPPEAAPALSIALREAKVATLMDNKPAMLLALEQCQKAVKSLQKTLENKENALANSVAEIERLQLARAPPPPISPAVCAAMQVCEGVSEKTVDLLRRRAKGVFPSRAAVRKVIDKATPVAKLHDFSDLGVKFVVADMGHILRLNLQSKLLKIPRTKRHHCIVIGGDGMYHRPKQRLGPRDKLLQGCMRWLDNGNDSHGISLLIAGFAAETPANVQLCAQVMELQMQLIEKEMAKSSGFEVEIDGIMEKHEFSFILSADMKWQRFAMDMVGGQCTHPCPYCICSRGRAKEKGYTERLIAECDQPFPINAPFSNYGMEIIKERVEIGDKMVMRTRENIAKWVEENRPKIEAAEAARSAAAAPPPPAAAAVATTKKKKKQPPLPDVYGHRHAPAFNFALGDLAPEELHMLLRLFSGRMDAIFVAILDELQEGKDYKGSISPNIHKRLKEIYLEMGMSVGITGLTGMECKKLLIKREKWASYIKDSPFYEHFLHALNLLHSLFMDFECKILKTAVEWRETAREFAIFVSGYWNNWYGGCVYLHILACHAWRFWPISRFSTCGLEKLNAEMKSAKNAVWNVGNAKAGEQMQQIMNKLNRRPMLSLHSPPRAYKRKQPLAAALPPPPAAAAEPPRRAAMRKRTLKQKSRKQLQQAAAATTAAATAATTAATAATTTATTATPTLAAKAVPPSPAAPPAALPAATASPIDRPKRLTTPTIKKVLDMVSSYFDD